MAVIDMDGFEAVNFSPANQSTDGQWTGAGGGRDGVGSGMYVSANFGDKSITRTFVAGSDELYGHFAHYSGGTMTFTLYGDSGSVTHLQLTWDGLRRLVAQRGSTTIATSTQTISATPAWYSIQWRFICHDTTGRIVVKVNGETWIDFTGDTRNAGTSTRMDKCYYYLRTNQGNRYDDHMICDTTGTRNNSWTGDVSIVAVRPAGNGANNELVGSDGNSVNNYQQVDESPMSMTDYNGSATVGAKDTYDMSSLAKTGTIMAVQSQTLANKSDAATKSIKTNHRTALGNYYASPAVALSTTALLLTGAMLEVDGDGNPWTTASLNAAEFGVEVA